MSETQELRPPSGDEIPLADIPESQPPSDDEIPLADVEQAESSSKAVANPYIPGQPLPRLWKAEPEPDADAAESAGPAEKKQKKATKGPAVAASASESATKPRAASPADKPKPKPQKKKQEVKGENGEKRVLKEETPAFDTVESRQRARLIMGGLIMFCIFIFGWIAWGMLFPGSGDFPVVAVDMPPPEMIPLAGPKPSRDGEARYMLDLARDYAKREQTKQAIAMLLKVVSVYKGTQAAAEAQAALNRPKQNLPLFPDRPFVVAEKKVDESRRPPAPAIPPVVAPSRPAPPIVTMAPPGSAPMPPPSASSGIPTAPPARTSVAMAPGSSSNPGTVGPAASPAPPRPLNVTGTTTAPPPNAAPNGPTGSMPNPPAAGPPPSIAPIAVATPPAQPQPQPQLQPAPQPPPPGPGDTALLIPSRAASEAAKPPSPANDRGETAPRIRPGRKLPPGFRAKPEAGLHESGWPMVIVGDRDGGNMVLVPGGTFLMGSDRGDPWNGPAHPVRVSTYYIDQYEVTNRQFRIFLQETKYQGHPPGKWLTDERRRSLPDDAPVVFVSYNDAEEYAMWALKRLPTEAQWEMAARSADGRRYPWGEQPIRWSHPRKFHQIESVASFPEDVSPFGVFGMAGNAVEWVRDWYDPRYFDRLKDQTTEDPAGPPAKRVGIKRVIKGCSKDGLVFDRQGMDLDQRLSYIGFRCSLAVEGSEASAIIAPRPAKPEAPRPGAIPTGGQDPGAPVPY